MTLPSLPSLPTMLDAPHVPFTALDRALVRALLQVSPLPEPPNPRHLWLAALASHQLGRGHACLDLRALEAEPQALLGWDAAAVAALPTGLAAAAADLCWAQGEGSPLLLVADAGDPPPSQRLYLRRAWSAEQRILANLAARRAAPLATPVDLTAALDELFTAPAPDGGVDWQRRACEVAALEHFSVITGGPGTGKTTTVARLLALLLRDARAQGRSLRVHLAAPTGKAAARLSQSIAARRADLPPDVRDQIPTEAATLHKLLGLRTGASAATRRTLATDLVIVDEASMVDLEMMATLLEAVPVSARLVLLGDKDQLASVEAGAVLAQLCENPGLAPHIVTLRYSHRFAADSGIGRWARQVNAGEAEAVAALLAGCPPWRASVPEPTAPPPASDAASDVGPAVQCLHAGGGFGPSGSAWDEALREGWQDWLEGLAQLERSGDPCSNEQAAALLDSFAAFQVLCALRQGPWGVETLNPRIQRSLGFPRDEWYAGRPVMVTRNDYALRLMNGDVGLCLPQADGLRVVFRDADGALRWVVPSRLEDVETVFAMTVHKSQGSEFRHVLLVLPDKPSPVLTRELLYTGITRAMRRLTLLAPARGVVVHSVRERVRRSGGLAGPGLTTAAR
jgi:exodeoxyribonuclease V alpha subunit